LKIKQNFFGNQISEIDFAELFTKFPHLEVINLQGNPLQAKNLNRLTSEQFGRLVKGIQDQKIRINSFKSTILMDLLEYARELVARGNPAYNAHVAQLQAIVKEQPLKNSPVMKTTTTNHQVQPKPLNTNFYLLVGGLVIFGAAILAIGY
jgi:hypothetical protein